MLKTLTAIMLTAAMVFVLVFPPPARAVIHEHDYEWPQDLGGRTIRLSLWWTDVHPFSAISGLTGERTWEDPDPRLQAHLDQVEEWFNINIEFVDPFGQGSAPQEIATQFISGDIQFDFAQVIRHDLLELHAEGFMKPLDEVFVDDYLQAIPDRWRFLYRPPLSAHKMFGIPYMFQDMGYALEEVGMAWNKEIFEEYGLPTPYELWEEGEWTLDAVETMAVELTQDTTGDGEINQWGLGNFCEYPGWWSGRFWHDLIVANEGSLTKEIEGKMTATLTEPQAIWMWEWIDRMRNDLEVASGSARVYNGAAAMMPEWFNAMGFQSNQQAAEDYNHTIGYLPFPQGPDAEYHRVPSANIWMGVMAVTEQNPRAIAEVVNALFLFKYPYIEPGTPRDQQLDIWYERYEEDWNMVVWDRETFEHLRWMTPRTVHSDHMRAAEAVGFWEAIESIDVEGRSISAAMNEIEPALQTYLDEMYGY